MGKESVKHQGISDSQKCIDNRTLAGPSRAFCDILLLSAAPTFDRGAIVIIFRWQMLIRLAALVSAYKGPDATQTLSFFPETHFHNFQTTPDDGT